MVQEALDLVLCFEQLKNLSSPGVALLIQNSLLSLDEVFFMSKEHLFCLNNTYKLIQQEVLSVAEAKNLTYAQVMILRNCSIYSLILKNCLTVEQALQLKPHQVTAIKLGGSEAFYRTGT